MTRVFAGGYTEQGARGLYPLSVSGGAITLDGLLGSIVNVSAGVCVPGTGRWFMVDENAGRIVLLDAGDGFRQLAAFSSGGKGPCHLALDPAARLLAAANYESGTVALFQLDRDNGLPIAPPAVHQESGSGPIADRQGSPHAHWVGFGPNGRLYSVDLGTDRVLSFEPDCGAGVLPTPAIAYRAPPGSGPRQLAFHPTLPLAFLVSELSSTLTVLRLRPDGTFTAGRILPTLPADACPDSLGGAIVLNDKANRLHISNRGHDSIASFAIDGSGQVTPLGHVASGGRSPRFLLLTGQYLLVAHEQAGGITMLPLDKDGRPGPSIARADVPGAAFLGVLQA